MLFITNAIKMISNYEQIIKRSSAASCSRQIKENSRGRKIFTGRIRRDTTRKICNGKEASNKFEKKRQLDLFIL